MKSSEFDSRVKGYNGKTTHPHLPLERTYCCHCGAARGWVTTETYEFIETQQIIVFCDLCEEKFRLIGGLPFVQAPIEEL